MARAEAQAGLNHMAGVIAAQAQALLQEQERRSVEVEIAAAALAVALARRIGGAALAAKPAALIEEAARECLVHARNAPHLAVRVAPDAVDAATSLFGRLAHENGYAGRVIVLGEPEIAMGDARLEWADGGVVIDHAALGSAIDQAVRRVLGDDAGAPAAHHPFSGAP
jgi:flagellar assembly protein FliH